MSVWHGRGLSWHPFAVLLLASTGVVEARPFYKAFNQQNPPLLRSTNC
jgi:hypothetical protein